MKRLYFVIPSYNSQDSVLNTLSSICNFIENYKGINWQFGIILTDDASIDNTLNIVKDFKHKYSISNKNLVIFDIIINSFNLGTVRNLKEAYHKILQIEKKYSDLVYIKTIAADDEIIPNQLSKLLELIYINNPDISINSVLTRNLNNGNIGYKSSMNYGFLNTFLGRAIICKYNYLVSPATIFNLKFACSSINLADSVGLVLMEDWIVGVMISKGGYNVLHSYLAPVIYNIRSTSVSNSKSSIYLSDLSKQISFNIKFLPKFFIKKIYLISLIRNIYRIFKFFIDYIYFMKIKKNYEKNSI